MDKDRSAILIAMRNSSLQVARGDRKDKRRFMSMFVRCKAIARLGRNP
jgi:hypothetical protein